MAEQDPNLRKELTNSEKYLVNEHVNDRLSKLAKWFGIGNISAVLVIIAVAWMRVPAAVGPAVDRELEKLLGEVEETVDVRIGNLEAQLTDANRTSAVITHTWKSLGPELDEYVTKAKSYALALQELEGDNADAFAQLISVFENAESGDLATLAFKIDGLEAAVAQLGTNRTGPTFTINGPRIGGADYAECPSGMFVTRIHATRSVGGKYGVDGISELALQCSPVEPKVD